MLLLFAAGTFIGFLFLIFAARLLKVVKHKTLPLNTSSGNEIRAWQTLPRVASKLKLKYAVHKVLPTCNCFSAFFICNALVFVFVAVFFQMISSSSEFLPHCIGQLFVCVLFCSVLALTARDPYTCCPLSVLSGFGQVSFDFTLTTSSRLSNEKSHCLCHASTAALVWLKIHLASAPTSKSFIKGNQK